MSKSFKLKLSRAVRVPSFQICRSKILSETQSPIPAIYKLSRFRPKSTDISYHNLNLPEPPPSTPDSRRKPFSRHSRSLAHFLADISIESPDFARKEGGSTTNWPARPYIQTLSFSDDSFESFCSVAVPEKQNECEIGETVTPLEFENSDFSFSCEADDEDEEGEEEGNEETDETSLLFSSRSFSCDSSYDFAHTMMNTQISENGSNRKTKTGKPKQQVSNKKYCKTKTVNSPVRSSVLRRMMSCKTTDQGKVKESVAVVKKSEDPYEDFKRSMLEMILEKQMFEGKDLEELLQCFLTLNSRKYHQVIVKAFSEIWEILFCDSPVMNTNYIRRAEPHGKTSTMSREHQISTDKIISHRD